MKIDCRVMIAVITIIVGNYITGCGGGGGGSSSTSTSPTSSKASIVGWNIEELGVLSGDEYSTAYDINESGEVVGESGTVYAGQSGVLWEDGLPESILGSGGGDDVATSINDQGTVAGVYYFLGGNNGIIRPKNGNFSLLTPPLNWYCSAINSINNIGHAAGTSGFRGFIYDGLSFTPIEPLAGDSQTTAVAINDSDMVVGCSTADPHQAVGRGFIYKDGIVTPIGFLPGATCSYPESINNHGAVVGSSDGQAFLYFDGDITPLGYLPGDSYSIAQDINDNGDIVGRSGSGAFLLRDDEMINLSSLAEVQQAGWGYLNDARAINNKGQIVGQGYRDGQFRAYVLTPLMSN